MPILLKPDVVDLSVHNDVADFNAVRASGIKGIIHKATEGTGFVDKRYAARRQAARDAGLLWGAYHFATAANAASQAKHYLKTSQWDERTLLCLDWEPYGANTMSLASAKEFLRIVYEETGQRPVIYSGNLIKEKGNGDPFLTKHRLWLAQYSKTPQLPRGFSNYWLWQYSGDGWGGHGTVPGITTRGIDVNTFAGSDLAAEWAGRPQDRREQVPAPVVPDFQTPEAEPPPEGAYALASAPRGAADGEEKATFASRLTNVTTNASAVNELADQGSRIASVLRSVKQLFWKGVVTAGAGGTVAAQTGVTEKGNGAVVHGWISAHPITFALLLSGLLAVIFYFAVKRIEKYLVTAYNAGRYVTKGE